MDNTKYDISLNGVGYRIRGYTKSEFNTFIPRLGAGEQKDSQFDLLRSASLKDFSGGELQRHWQDDTSAYGIEGLYNKYDDGVLYPVNGLESDNGEIYGGTKPDLLCWVRSADYLYTAYRTYSSPTGSFLIRYDKSGTATSITLPASISSASIVDMVIKDGQLWLTTNGANLGYMALSATTITAITGGSGVMTSMVVYRGSLYGMGTINKSVLNRYTGNTTTRSYEPVGDIGKGDVVAKCLLYNNRIIITRNDGLYAYDGVQMVTIEDQRGAENPYNYYKPEILKGYLYYFMPDGYYRFNGSLIEKLYDVSEVGFPVDSCNGDNKIWFVYSNADTLSSRYDKSLGYDYTSTGNLGGRVAFFDGKGMYTYDSFLIGDKDTIEPDFEGQGVPNGIIHFNNQVWVTTYMTKTFDNLFKSKTTAPTTNAWQIVTSIFDGDFPQIDKNFENLELAFDGTVVAESITLQYRTSGFDGGTGWTTFGTINSSTEKKRYTWKSITSGLTFRKIQFRITGTTDLDYGIEKLILRYTLTPDYKYQWQFNALCYGDKSLEPLVLADRTESAQAVADLRGNIYDARDSDTPVLFVDTDQLDLNGAINNSVTTVTLDSTKLLKGQEGFIKIDDEIMYYSARTSTTLTVVRGVLGTSAASHSDNSKVFIVYRVIVRQIMNENIEMQDDGADDFTVLKSKPSEITLLLQEV